MAALLVPSSAQAAVEFLRMPLEEAIGRARSEDKLLLVDVFATWCGPCQELDHESFEHPDVVAETREHFIALKVNGEEGEGGEVMRRYHVVGFPTLLVLGPDGTEIDRVFGFQDGPTLASTLQSYRDGVGTLSSAEERLRQQPDDVALVADVAARLVVKGEWDRASPLVDRVLRADRRNSHGLASKILLQVGRYHYLRGREDWPAALDTYRRLRRRFPTSPEAQGGACALDVAKSLHRLGRDPEAMAELERYIGHGPTEPDRYNAVGFFLFRERWALGRAEGFARVGLTHAPDDASLWDTFAELLSAQGKHDEAVAAAEHASGLEPSNPYFHSQLDRFRAAARARPPAATQAQEPLTLRQIERRVREVRARVMRERAAASAVAESSQPAEPAPAPSP